LACRVCPHASCGGTSADDSGSFVMVFKHGGYSGEEVSFSLRYSRITDRLTPPIRVSKKKHNAKPGGFPSRVGIRNQNSQ
jgi:hypothetical protein